MKIKKIINITIILSIIISCLCGCHNQPSQNKFIKHTKQYFLKTNLKKLKLLKKNTKTKIILNTNNSFIAEKKDKTGIVKIYATIDYENSSIDHNNEADNDFIKIYQKKGYSKKQIKNSYKGNNFYFAPNIDNKNLTTLSYNKFAEKKDKAAYMLVAYNIQNKNNNNRVTLYYISKEMKKKKLLNSSIKVKEYPKYLSNFKKNSERSIKLSKSRYLYRTNKTLLQIIKEIINT